MRDGQTPSEAERWGGKRDEPHALLHHLHIIRGHVVARVAPEQRVLHSRLDVHKDLQEASICHPICKSQGDWIRGEGTTENRKK